MKNQIKMSMEREIAPTACGGNRYFFTDSWRIYAQNVLRTVFTG